jgi:hypothetical protein
VRSLALALLAAALRAGVPLAAQAPPAPVLEAPADTSLTPATRWPLRVRTARTTLITVMLAPLAPDAPPLRIESRLVRQVETFWPLQLPGGAALEPGFYRLQIVAQDSASGAEASRVRVLAIEQVAADTQRHPPALDGAAFLPESTVVTQRRPGFLLIAGIGVASLATAWSFQDGDAFSPITIAVPAGLAVGGLVGFLKGRAQTQAVPDNVAHNRRLVDEDVAARQAIVGANARVREAAAARVRILDQP